MSLIPTSSGTPTVFVVDDDVSVRRSLESLIARVGWRSQTFASAMDFLICPRCFAPSCLVLNVAPSDANGGELQRRITIDRAEMPVIIITREGDVPMAVEAMKAGAFEFLIKPLGNDVLLSAIRRAIGRSQETLARQAAMRALRGRYALLSHREREVMKLVVTGRPNKAIACELGISEITVKAHRGKMTRKMQADSLADLVTMAVRLGLASDRADQLNVTRDHLHPIDKLHLARSIGDRLRVIDQLIASAR